MNLSNRRDLADPWDQCFLPILQVLLLQVFPAIQQDLMLHSHLLLQLVLVVLCLQDHQQHLLVPLCLLVLLVRKDQLLLRLLAVQMLPLCQGCRLLQVGLRLPDYLRGQWLQQSLEGQLTQ